MNNCSQLTTARISHEKMCEQVYRTCGIWGVASNSREAGLFDIRTTILCDTRKFSNQFATADDKTVL